MQTNCVVVWHGSPPHFTGRWDDRSCVEEKHGYICQRSIGRGGCRGDGAPLSGAGGCQPPPSIPQQGELWAMGSAWGEHGAVGRGQEDGLSLGGAPGPSGLWGTPKPVCISLAW